MTVKQYFTARGLWGVVLFVLSPIGSGLCYLIWTGQPAYDTSNFPLFLAGIFSVLQFASIPLMLVGRQYEVEKP